MLPAAMKRLLPHILLLGLAGNASSANTSKANCSIKAGTEEASLLTTRAKTGRSLLATRQEEADKYFCTDYINSVCGEVTPATGKGQCKKRLSKKKESPYMQACRRNFPRQLDTCKKLRKAQKKSCESQFSKNGKQTWVMSDCKKTLNEKQNCPGTSSAKCNILVLSTQGAKRPCCGLLSASDCGLMEGNDMYKMAKAFREGVRNVSIEHGVDCAVRIVDMSKECPSTLTVQSYDAIIVNAPSHEGTLSPDMLVYLSDLGLDGFQCKVGGAMTSNGAYYTGAQPVMEAIRRSLMQKGMTFVGGANWNTGEGAAEIHGSWPWDSMATPDQYFLTDAEAMGARVANVTMKLKALQGVCGSMTGKANMPFSDPKYSLLQQRSSEVPVEGWEWDRPPAEPHPKWPGWKGEPGDRKPAYVKLYEDPDFTWLDPTCSAKCNTRFQRKCDPASNPGGECIRYKQDENCGIHTKVLVITTAGGNGGPSTDYKKSEGGFGACCGCPDPSDGKRCGCFRHTGDRTLQVAQALRMGFTEATGGCKKSGIAVDIFDLTQNSTNVTGTACPSWNFVKGYDAFVFGSPSWNGLPTADILGYTNLWPLSDTDLRCKPVMAISSSGGFTSGGQMVIESLHRMAMTFQTIPVAAGYWSMGQGVAANTGTWPFTKGVEMDDGSEDSSVSPYFLNQAWGQGYRLANLTMGGKWKALARVCGDYPAQMDANRR